MSSHTSAMKMLLDQENAITQHKNIEHTLDAPSISSSLASSILQALRARWPEYCIEAVLLAVFMLSACFFSVLLEDLSSMLLRRFIGGAAMGLTAIALVYSPLGQRSGSHINPSITLAYHRLARIGRLDAAFYIIAQFIGGVSGVLLAHQLLGAKLASKQVHYAATFPGHYGYYPAALSEFIISFLLMFTVLSVSSSKRYSKLTGVVAGLLVASFITLEAPFSGMSMNPARTFASALPSGIWSGFWIYLVIPPLGMVAAAALFTRGARDRGGCCKLYHNPQKPCIFCGINGGFR